MTARRLAIAVVAGALAALALPTSALAHATEVGYRFPLPLWLYSLGGALAVLASVPAAALAVGAETRGATRNFYPLVRRVPLAKIGVAVATILLAFVVAGGLFGSILFEENPATVIVWVDFWVGLGLVSALVGNLWDFVSPLSAAGRQLEGVLARRGVPARPYPDWLGLWPSVFLLLVWSWIELVWNEGDAPRTLVLVLLAYLALQLTGMAYFGTEVWLARGELFTVLARTFARFAPLELYVARSEGECRARRCTSDERIGCPSCCRDADPDRRGVRLRAWGAGIGREPRLGHGGSAFVLALLGTVVYDGVSRTRPYVEFKFFTVRPHADWLFRHGELLDTLALAAIVVGFVVAFLAIAALVALFEQGGPLTVARRYAPSLIPIAAVYFVSHYFLYLIYAGQYTPAVLLDPFEREWISEYTPWTGVPATLVWYLQVALIVWGHVVAVFEAHRLSLAVHDRPQSALRAQVPLVVLMASYTAAGLWVLGQALQG
jgi:hypothetical protein